MKTVLCFVVIAGMAVLKTNAQPFVRDVDGIPVNISGQALSIPFAGGVNTPNHQFVDIDADNDYDLFVFDSDLLVEFFRNEGTAVQHAFKSRQGAVTLPTFQIWFLFFDYDVDGLPDLLTEDSLFTGIRIYRNTGTPQNPQFSLVVSSLLDSAGQPVFAGQNSVPALTDIDGDGDRDLFSSNFSGSVNFYQNIGGPGIPLFAYRTSNWQGILILGDSCYSNGGISVQHGASAYRFADIDADCDPDFFVGDAFWDGVFFIRNDGTCQIPSMECQTAYFPPADPMLTVNKFNQASFVDIDADGDLDFFGGVLGALAERNTFWFYRNTGTPTTPSFQRETRDFLSVLDVGSHARPALVDIDADADLDLFVGSLTGQLWSFENTGSPGAPSFVLRDTMYQAIAGGFAYSPSFVDIDGDGDSDLFIGMFDGRIKFYRNAGTPDSAAFSLEPSPVDTILVGTWCAPAFADIDADGDYDLFAGKANGRLSFYRNVGSPSSFQPVLESTWYQNIVAGQNSVPAFLDLDNDLDQDLFIGTSEGRTEHFQNFGSPSNAQFQRVTNHFAGTDPMKETAPCFGDIDGDGDDDFFTGTSKGGIHLYRNDQIVFAASGDVVPDEIHLAQNYPNPFNPGTNIQFSIAAPSGRAGNSQLTILMVYDMLGREVATLVNREIEPGTHKVVFRPVGLGGGVYFYRLQVGDRSVAKRMVLIR